MILQGEEKILTGNWKTLGNTGNFVIWIYADTTKICTIFLENLKSYLNKHWIGARTDTHKNEPLAYHCSFFLTHPCHLVPGLRQKQNHSEILKNSTKKQRSAKGSDTGSEYKAGGKVLKPVDKSKNPGLSKLPTKVRNKMGYMKKGGRVMSKRGMGKAMRGGGCVR